MVYARLYYHLVWTTKNREPIITGKMESELFPYLLKKASNLDCKILATNAYFDHIHLIMEIPPKHSISDIVKALKGSSSFDFSDLYWQRGYGVLTISERNLQVAIEYVNNQKEHHSMGTTFSRYEWCEDEEIKSTKAVKEMHAEYESHEEDIF